MERRTQSDRRMFYYSAYIPERRFYDRRINNDRRQTDRRE